MTVARNQQICVEETPYYNVVSRCVRRAYHIKGIGECEGVKYLPLNVYELDESEKKYAVRNKIQKLSRWHVYYVYS